MRPARGFWRRERRQKKPFLRKPRFPKLLSDSFFFMQASFKPLALATALACAAPCALAQTAADNEAIDLQEVRIYATSEKDIGFAPKKTETADKMPMRMVENAHIHQRGHARRDGITPDGQFAGGAGDCGGRQPHKL